MNIHSAMTTSTPRLFFALFLICSAISEPEDLCSCPLFQSERDDFQVGNVVILSATGRVGSSNLLAMLGSHPRIRDLGEIFIASQFRSLGLPLNKKSPRETPAPGHHKRRMVTHIIERMKSSHSRLRSESGTLNRLASVKFWHAWENGVDIAWMVRHLHSCGCVTHFVLIARNPVRVTISEQFANRYKSWEYKKYGKNAKISACDKSYLSHHVGAQWLGEMVSTHFEGFHQVSEEISGFKKKASLLGLSYEADILRVPKSAYKRIVRFLNLELHDPPVRHKKGMTCALSDLLINVEELRCSLFRWEQAHSKYSNETGNLQWMSTDYDDPSMTFERIMSSWKFLYFQLSADDYNRHISECSLEDIIHTQRSYPGIILSDLKPPRYWRFKRQRGLCGVGGETHKCKGLPAVPSDRPEFCLFSGRRAGCDGMTFKDGNCYLHKKAADFRVESCSRGSWYQNLSLGHNVLT